MLRNNLFDPLDMNQDLMFFLFLCPVEDTAHRLRDGYVRICRAAAGNLTSKGSIFRADDHI